MVDPFDVLQLDPGADEEAVVRAYRRRVKETHPDHGGSVEAFQAVREAYATLTSERARAERADDADAEAQAPPPETRVQFLNYEVLADRGWALDDADLFEKAAAAGLDASDYGRIEVSPDESLLEAAESCGLEWPYACRGGACANCAVAVTAGELAMPVDHILSSSLMDRGFRLSCNGVPATGEMRVVYNVKHLPGLDELRLPPRPFERASAGD